MRSQARSRAWIALTSLLITATPVFASPQHPVVPGRYVVELAAPLVAADGGSVPGLAGRVVKQLSTATVIEVPQPAGDRAEGDVSTSNEHDPFCRSLIESGRATSCSPDYILRIDNTPNDPRLPAMWGMGSGPGIAAPEGWQHATGSEEIVVAVIDSGIDYTHPDLVDNLWHNSGEIPGNGIDDDGNGYVDDVYGINVLNRTGNPYDQNGHGTHVAGIIGARGNNGIGVSGVNWNVRLMAVRFLDAYGTGSVSGAIEAIDYVIMMRQRGVNVRLSNNSWGGGAHSQPLLNAIERARNAGVLFVAAAGNEASNIDATPSYPSAYPSSNIVSVAAIDAHGNLAPFSNYGALHVDIAAPGVGILSTYPANRYVTLNGTSMAAPHVTGALALLLSLDPTLSNEALLTRLYESAVDSAALHGLVRTGRRLHLGRLMSNITTPVPSNGVGQECIYRAVAAPVAIDRRVESAPVVVNSDELGFYNLALPFDFPFYDRTVRNVILSPNGVIYTQRAPTTMDYITSSQAPLQSIAALHTDLMAGGYPYGVRAITNSSQATIFYRMRHFGMPSGGDVLVWVTLHANGVIEQRVEFGSSTLASFVQRRATVGISGSSPESAVTWSHNSSALYHGLELRYEPHCGAVPPPASGVSIAAIEVRKRARARALHRIRTGTRFDLALLGSGTGQIELNAALDGRRCRTSRLVQVTDGEAMLQGRAVRRLEAARIAFIAGGVRQKISLRGTQRRRRTARAVQQDCRRVFRTIRPQ